MEAALHTGLAQYGAIGLLALAAIFAVSKLWQAFREEQRGRLDDQRRYEVLLREHAVALTQAASAMEALREALEDEAPAQPAPAPPEARRKTRA